MPPRLCCTVNIASHAVIVFTRYLTYLTYLKCIFVKSWVTRYSLASWKYFSEYDDLVLKCLEVRYGTCDRPTT